MGNVLFGSDSSGFLLLFVRCYCLPGSILFLTPPPPLSLRTQYLRDRGLNSLVLGLFAGWWNLKFRVIKEVKNESAGCCIGCEREFPPYQWWIGCCLHLTSSGWLLVDVISNSDKVIAKQWLQRESEFIQHVVKRAFGTHYSGRGLNKLLPSWVWEGWEGFVIYQICNNKNQTRKSSLICGCLVKSQGESSAWIMPHDIMHSTYM